MEISIPALFSIIFILAFMVETLTEATVGTIFDKVPRLVPFKWTIMYIAMIVGVVGSFVYNLDIMYFLGIYLKQNIAVTIFGKTITGLAIGRGSNFIHDLVVKFLNSSAKPG
jgi:hypothetical protein